jgi:hypothetical protein
MSHLPYAREPAEWTSVARLAFGEREASAPVALTSSRFPPREAGACPYRAGEGFSSATSAMRRNQISGDQLSLAGTVQRFSLAPCHSLMAVGQGLCGHRRGFNEAEARTASDGNNVLVAFNNQQ